MATTTTKPDLEMADPLSGTRLPAWPAQPASGASNGRPNDRPSQGSLQKPSQRDALQALLAFSALHDQLRRRKALAARQAAFDSPAPVPEFEPCEQFVLDEVLQLVAERAVAITGADGLAIALAENNEIVLRAAAGVIRPDIGARIDRDSAFSGACFRTAQIINCDDTEVDPRVNLEACRKLGARSMVAVPLCGRRRVIGVLEAFSSWPFGFNDSDVRNLTLLAELILAALKPEDDDRFAESAQGAATKLDPPKPAAATLSAKPEPPKPIATPAAPESPRPVAPPVAMQPVRPSPSPAPLESAKPTSPVPATPQPPKPAVPAPAAKIPAAETAKPPIQPSAARSPLEPTPASTLPLKTPALSIATSVPPQTAPKIPAAIPAPPAVKKVEVPVAPAAAVPKAPTPAATTPAAEKIAAAPTLPEKVAVVPSPTPLPEKVAAAVPVPLPEKIAAAAASAPAAVEAPVALMPPEFVLTFGQLEPEGSSRRPWIVVLLVVIVVATAFAAGVWWKLKTSQLGGQIVHNQPAIRTDAAKPAAPVAANSTPASAEESPAESQPTESPATPQELAKFPRVAAVRHWSSADSSTVVLDLEDQVQYEPGHLANPERFYFDLRDTQLAPELQGKSFDGDSLLSRIRIAQPIPGMTRVVLEARPSAALSAPQVSLERDPYRLVIQVNKAGAAPKGAVNLFPSAPQAEKNKLAIVVPPPTKEDLQLRARVPKLRIVVDAGHGGWDLGTVGRRGLLEKDLVLEIAERLGKLLESRLGADVIYTRKDDNYIPLDERAEIANQAQADLFISVHANYSDLPSARGVETYYTNFFSAPGPEANPADPKLAALHSTAKAPTLTPAELHERIEQSRRLAASVQRSLYGMLAAQNPGIRDRGVKEAGFVVLTESAMPGILAEVSFVSSPTDEQKLRSDGYREEIAEALYRGVARYAATSKGVKVAAKQGPLSGGK